MANPKLDKQYAQAQKQGQGAVSTFLAAHPKYANRMPGDTGPVSPPGTTNTGQTPNVSGNKVQNAINNEVSAADFEQGKQTVWGNPNYSTPFGGQTVTFDANGNPVYNSYLSEANQNIVNQGQGLTQTGQQMAQSALTQFSPYQMGDYGARRDQAADAVYERLTKNYDRDFDREEENLRQRFHNMGRPWDENNPEVQAMRDSHQAARDDASNQAYITGGQEYDRQFTSGLTSHQQNYADISNLSNMGTGYVAPQLPGYQAPTPYQLPSPTDINLSQKQLDLQKKQIEYENQIAQKQLSLAGGGGGSQQPAPPPFP